PADRRAAGSRWRRQWALLLPSDPFLAIGTTLLFPDGNRLLETIDDHPTRLERFATMRRGAGDDDRCLADFEEAEAMGDRSGNLRKTCMNIINNFRNLLFGHRAVGVIENRLHSFSLMVVADDAFENDARAIRGAHDFFHQIV